MGPIGFVWAFMLGQRCPRCGTKASIRALICPNCACSLLAGNALPSSSSQSQPAPTKKCPFCAETVLAEAKKCRHCGEFLESQPQPHLPSL